VGAAQTRALVERAGGSAEFFSLDIRDEAGWESLRSDLQDRWPQLDLLVNNAGVSCSGEVGESTIEDWDWVLSINLRGVVLGCHTMVDWLKANPNRSYVLNIGSAAALLCGPGMAAYNVAKAGVVALSQSMYVELKGHNVGVTCACPWFIQTELLKSGRFAKDSHRTFAEKAMAKARVTPEIFAKEVLDATFAGRLIVVPGRRPKLATALKRLFPQTFLNLLHRHIRRLPPELESEEAPVVERAVEQVTV
jgi:NAD(P)-dependent dehydrogenase (short-subunit alcohol dehydrogenase family)